VLQRARDEIWASWRRACAENADHPRAKELFNRHKLPAFHDPFAGGGTIPLEAQRLGLEAYASDLNPVPVLINKAMIEIPPKFAGRPPVNPMARAETSLIARQWQGAEGLAEDVRYYGKWMREEAEKSIGKFYPKIEVTAAMAKERPDLKSYVGQRLTVIAWLWARTVKSPNPAFAGVDVPLASTFMLSAKAGKEAYVDPVIENGSYRFTVKVGRPKNPDRAKRGTKLARGANFECLMSGTPMSGDYIKAEGRAGRMGSRLMAIVAEAGQGRIYLAPTAAHETLASEVKPKWKPDGSFVEDARAFTPCIYGIKEWQHLFMSRQILALTTFSDLVDQAIQNIRHDSSTAGLAGDNVGIGNNGSGAAAYAEAVGVYLAFAVDRCADYWSSLAMWAGDFVAHTFGRQALSMTWDFAEANPMSDSTGNWLGAVDWVSRVMDRLPATVTSSSQQADAVHQALSKDKVVSTDPPYYDNVPYADLSDFFYVWLRKPLRNVFPDLFATLAVPKDDELVATSYRHGGKDKAEAFFLAGMTGAMQNLAALSHPAFPVTIYYAFKQAEKENETGSSSTGWETFLEAVIAAGFTIDGTWPIRTERPGRLRETASNALASSIVLVCRTRVKSPATATRRDFIKTLKLELPGALTYLQRGNIAPVDLAQAAIGPGMAVYTRYAQVLDAEGNPLSVRDALALINQTLDEALAEQEGDFDADTRWALAWFEQHGFSEGKYGVAETLSKAKNTSVDGLVDAGILASRRGDVRLLKPEELPDDWDPESDMRVPAWEVVHHLIRVLASGGEGAAATLVKKLGTKAEIARELAYRLFAICERKKRANEALAYNGLVQSFPEITRLAREGGTPTSPQPTLFAESEA
jgi:putative DNA methylase